jgi:hypothetical protein
MRVVAIAESVGLVNQSWWGVVRCKVVEVLKEANIKG